MTVILVEYRVHDISDVSSAFKSVFIERAIDINNIYRMEDVTMMKDPEIIYSIFLSKYLLEVIYFDDIAVGDLFSIPSFFKPLSLVTETTQMHFLKFNNYIMGASLKIVNMSKQDGDFQILNTMYNFLQADLIIKANDTTNVSSEDSNTSLNIEELKNMYPNDSFIQRENAETVTFLLPGDINITVAEYIVGKAKNYLVDHSNYIKEISLTLYMFNPINEIALQGTLTYTRNLQGTLSFTNTIMGGFPMLYYSHQFDKGLLNFYFVVKIVFMIWTICMFLYEFLTVIFFIDIYI